MLKKLNFFMKKLIFLCLVLISNTCLSQELLWEINNTGSNHTLLLPLEENVTLDGVEIDESALVGVFYEIEGGGLQCGGFTSYSIDQFQIAAYGDDATTEEKDGFNNEEDFQWYINFNGVDYPAEAVYSIDFDPGVYVTNAMTFVTILIIVEPGCTDETALNYDENATIDDGSCIDTIEGCTDVAYIEYNPLANVDDGSCMTLEVFGCTEETALNYNTEATTDDGSCQIEGCMDAAAINYNPIANIDDASCLFNVYGCMDDSYIEYDAQANIDDGSCQNLIVYGCLNESADNYNPLANVDDGSCVKYKVVWISIT